MENQNQQNLDLIASMIKTAQRRFYDDSPFYILWGTTIFLACIIQYLSFQIGYANGGIAWAILIPLALIIQIILVKKQKQREKTKTHMESLLISMWVAFGITLFIILFFSFRLSENTYPVVLCLYAITTYISGSAFKIKAFIFGAIACWILAIASFFVTFENQILLLALGVLTAFIIPGVILRSSEKAEKLN